MCVSGRSSDSLSGGGEGRPSAPQSKKPDPTGSRCSRVRVPTALDGTLRQLVLWCSDIVGGRTNL